MTEHIYTRFTFTYNCGWKIFTNKFLHGSSKNQWVKSRDYTIPLHQFPCPWHFCLWGSSFQNILLDHTYLQEPLNIYLRRATAISTIATPHQNPFHFPQDNVSWQPSFYQKFSSIVQNPIFCFKKNKTRSSSALLHYFPSGTLITKSPSTSLANSVSLCSLLTHLEMAAFPVSQSVLLG